MGVPTGTNPGQIGVVRDRRHRVQRPAATFSAGRAVIETGATERDNACAWPRGTVSKPVSESTVRYVVGTAGSETRRSARRDPGSAGDPEERKLSPGFGLVRTDRSARHHGSGDSVDEQELPVGAVAQERAHVGLETRV